MEVLNFTNLRLEVAGIQGKKLMLWLHEGLVLIDISF